MLGLLHGTMWRTSLLPYSIQRHEQHRLCVISHVLTCASACRFPIGGESISVTSGVVSRIEVTSYVHGAAELLGVQIDAAINSGNSGGPAFNNRGQCVGIAFQSLKVTHLPWHALAKALVGVGQGWQ